MGSGRNYPRKSKIMKNQKFHETCLINAFKHACIEINTLHCMVESEFGFS